MEFLALAFGLGLILGSFYTVCVHRYIEGQSIVWPGSRCPACGHGLRWYENIPLASWLIQGGRCRACRTSISARYPIMELTSGLWSLALAWKFGPTAPYVVYMVFGGALIVASFIDFELYILPDVITLTGSALALTAAPLLLGLPWAQSVVGALAGWLTTRSAALIAWLIGALCSPVMCVAVRTSRVTSIITRGKP